MAWICPTPLNQPRSRFELSRWVNVVLKKVQFLKAIFHYLNDLNLSLQGAGKTAADLYSRMRGFASKCTLYLKDLREDEGKIFFPKVPMITPVMVKFVEDLQQNFFDRLDDTDLPMELTVFVRNPFMHLHPSVTTEARQLLGGQVLTRPHFIPSWLISLMTSC